MLPQKMMAELYDVSVVAINQHIKRIYDDSEQEQESTIKKYLIVQTEGSRQVNREVAHYNLQMIIAVGFKVNNERATGRAAYSNEYGRFGKEIGWLFGVQRN